MGFWVLGMISRALRAVRINKLLAGDALATGAGATAPLLVGTALSWPPGAAWLAVGDVAVAAWGAGAGAW